MSGQTLAERIAEAVGEALSGEITLGYDAIVAKLPQYLVEARPSKKVIVGAIRGAGWTPFKDGEGTVQWRAPASISDPLRRHGDEGHNIAAEELRLLIERAERLEEEKKGIADDIKDVFAEAKNRGYDAKAIKKIMQIRKKSREEHQEEEMILETYMLALGMI